MPKKAVIMTKAIDAKVRAQVVVARKKGGSYAALAKRFDIAEGSVRNILNAAAKAKKPSASTAAPVAPLPAPVSAQVVAPAPGADPVFDALLSTIDGLASKAAKDGDVPALATLTRLATGCREHLRKAAPPADEPEGTFVKKGDLDAAAARVRQRLHDRIGAIVREHGAEFSGPPCPTCGNATRLQVGS